ncbi:MAG: hypothetical protein Q4G25_12430 [Paracoccus sp. (in: a-proteobacteria)]|nr:hypothetical protein [Paracoccus sp. (in: a-proteobacteria)]
MTGDDSAADEDADANGDAIATQPAAPGAFSDLDALVHARGGFMTTLTRHVLAHIPARTPQPAGSRRLIVAFDSLNSHRTDEPRMPWGYRLLDAQGWDVLGVLANAGDFYRSDELFDALEALRDTGFFAQFDHVSMYGTSMGGYGATTFAGLAPGCTVVAFAPQSSLVADIAPFDRRYSYARRLFPWAGRYVDAAEGFAHAGPSWLFYDPMIPEDRQHIARLVAANPRARAMACPFMSHKLPPAFLRMGLLKPVALAALQDQLDPAGFRRMIRVRHDNNTHVLRLAQAAQARGRLLLAERALVYRLSIARNWRLRQLLREIRRQKRALAAG